MIDSILNQYIDELNKNFGRRTSLSLKSDSITKEQIKRLSEALKKNTTLTSLTLEYMKIGEEGALIIAEALKENKSISELTLTAANIGDIGFAAIAIALETDNKISSLHLENNNITDMGMPRLAELIKKNKKLRWIELDHNNITNTGAALLVDPLKQNDSLKSLVLNRADLQRFNRAILESSEDDMLAQFAEPMISLQANSSLLGNVVIMGYLRLLNKLLDIPEIVLQVDQLQNRLLKLAVDRKQLKIIERLLQIESVYNMFKANAAEILSIAMINDDVTSYKVLLASLTENKKAQQLAQTLKLAIKNLKVVFCDYVLNLPNLNRVLRAFEGMIHKTLAGKPVRNKFYGYINFLFSTPNGHRFLQANDYYLCVILTPFFLNLYNKDLQSTYAQELKMTISGRDILSHSGFMLENGVARLATPEEKTLQQRLVILEQKQLEARQLLTQVTQLRALHFAVRFAPHKQENERQIPLYPASPSKRLKTTPGLR